MIIKTDKNNDKVFELYRETGNDNFLSLYQHGFTFADGENAQGIVERLQNKGITVNGEGRRYLQK